MVVDVLSEAGGRRDAIALITSEAALSYGRLQEVVDARAEALRSVGTQAGRVQPVEVESDHDGIVELLAIWRVGAVPVPLNPALTKRERDDARARLAGAEVEVPAGTQVVLWTSGTSGRPRGVALSWANLRESARGTTERLALTSDDVWLASLSMAHVGGLALVVRSLIMGGGLVAAGVFRTEVVSSLLDGDGFPGGPAGRITHLSLVPTQLLRLLDHRAGTPPPDTLRCALIGGAHAPASLVDRAHGDGWPLALTYGATEMSSQIATAPPELTRSKPGTVGGPMPGVELEIEPDGSIRTRGPTRALGYLGDVGPPLGEAGGWYRTGDLGHLDSDGHLWITGRRVDRIVSGGVTIDAIEVEEALRGHASVADVCVVGLPDEEWGERVAAWIEPRGDFDRGRVEAYLRGLVSPAKFPRLWRTEGQLPRNVNGKVDRAEVRAVLEADRLR